ncbi:hypothetical protein RRG08_042710 [Elysia crispata]|uniref:Uncharacterized protein n=1 Tax=Elysia crispata TaxID=231223 RepID=A0AAE0XRH5_9GAST|nr:hypothetical protein RRG08_042710 [Elysia crispata]
MSQTLQPSEHPQPVKQSALKFNDLKPDMVTYLTESPYQVQLGTEGKRAHAKPTHLLPSATSAIRRLLVGDLNDRVGNPPVTLGYSSPKLREEKGPR